MFTGEQFLAHLIGDYVLQSHWMATLKRQSSLIAAIHALTYTIPFLFITWSLWALVVITGTHFVIDRFGLARFVVWFKNGPWHPLTPTGYPENVPVWLAVWLTIIVDNIIHIIINGLAIYYL